MLFPRTIFASINDIMAQLDHLRSEVEEVREALSRGDYDAAAEELVDVQHSADTALHILREQHGAKAYDAYTTVTIRNGRRGYYGTPVPPCVPAGGNPDDSY